MVMKMQNDQFRRAFEFVSRRLCGFRTFREFILTDVWFSSLVLDRYVARLLLRSRPIASASSGDKLASMGTALMAKHYIE